MIPAPMTKSRPTWLLPMTVFVTMMMMMCGCSSEAFASKYHNSFFGRRCLRGGGGATTSSTDTVTCVLQAPPRISSIQGEGSEEPKRSNGARAFYRPKRYFGLEDSSGVIQDVITAAEYVAETKLPTDIGQFQLRAYRIPNSGVVHSEPCVIYSREKPPFGNATHYAQHVPVRIHDQCLTSEVFRSQRYDRQFFR